VTVFPPGLMLVLPSALAAAQERGRLMDRTPDGVLLDPRIYTFGRLEAEMSPWFISDRKPIPPLGREMLLGRIIDEEADDSSPSGRTMGPGLRRRLLDLLDQLKLGGVSPETFDRLLLESGRDAARHLARIHARYEARLLDQGLIDHSGIRRAILEGLRSGRVPPCLERIREVNLVGFSRLTPFQTELIGAVSQAVDRVRLEFSGPEWLFELNLEQHPDWPDNPFQESLAALRHLEGLNPAGGGALEIVLRPPRDPSSPAGRWMAAGLFRPWPPEGRAPQAEPGLAVFAAPGRYAEIETIGRRIWDLLDRGVRPESVALALPDLGRTGPMVEDVFRRFRLPLFFRRGEPLAVQAPVRTLLALVRLARSDWERERVLDLLASPFLNLNFDWTRAAGLCARAGVTDERAGGGWEFNLRRLAGNSRKDRADALALLEVVNRLRVRVEPLAGEQTWPEFARAARSLLEELGLDEAVFTRTGPHLARNAWALAALYECLDQMVQAVRQTGLAEEKRSADDLTRDLTLALRERNIGRQGQPASGVQVLNLYDLHGLRFDHLFLAGLNEGDFPRPHPEGVLMDDPDRRALNQAAGAKVLQTSAAQYRQEELLFYHALTAADRQVVLSYSRQDDRGRLRLPSALIDEVLRLWPEGEVQVRQTPLRIAVPPGQALSRDQLIGGLARTVLRNTGPNESPDGDEAGSRDEPSDREILAALKERPEEADRWQDLSRRVRMFQGPPEESGGRVAPERLVPWLGHLKKHEGLPLLSPTRLERYGRCPFAFWAQVVLGLEPMDDTGDEMSVLDEGALVHQVLRDFLSACRDRAWLPLSGRDGEDELLRITAQAVWDRAESSRPVGRLPLWQVRKTGLTRLLARWLTWEKSRGSELSPAHFEWAFGPEGPNPVLTVPFLDGGGLAFQGRIDRIDRDDNLGLVLDYKLSSNQTRYNRLLDPDELGRTSFQAPLYQAAAAQALGLPCSAAWVLLGSLKGPRLSTTPATDDDLFALDPDRRRALAQSGRDNVFNRLEAVWLELTGGRFAPRDRDPDCEYCEFQRSCRTTAGEAEP